MWGLLSREAGETGVGVTVAVFLEKTKSEIWNERTAPPEPARYVTDDPSQMLKAWFPCSFTKSFNGVP